MPEVRLNLISREWVIIAKERAKRPDEFIKKTSKPVLPEHEQGCPFCFGNEGLTPPETHRFPDKGDWLIRVFPNKFYALAHYGVMTKDYRGMKRCVSGVGQHEVLVETPKHNAILCNLDLSHIKIILDSFKIILMQSYENPIIKHLIIFKNYGEEAGTSLIHPHSQIIGTPIIPMQIRDRLNAYLHFYEDAGKCLFCKTLEDEIKDKERIIVSTKHFVAFIPYAALSPFHIWIFPKKHCATFAEIKENELKDLALILKKILTKIHLGLNDPSYNMVLRTLQPKDHCLEYFHWYISVIPRVSKAAGFELGSGMFINTTLPEDSAQFLSKVADGL